MWHSPPETFTNRLLSRVTGDLSIEQVKQLCERSGIQLQNIKAWETGRANARVDLLAQFLDAAGYELTMKKKQKTRLITRDGRIEAFRDGEMIGYVENDVLFGIDAKGYATEIGPINHRVEIAGKLDKWQAKGA